VDVNHDEEEEDEVEYQDTDLEGVEEHKSIILHLLSQLKLGMDLTKVGLLGCPSSCTSSHSSSSAWTSPR